MSRTAVRKFKVAALLALPLLALAVAVLVLTWGHSQQSAEAVGGPYVMGLSVKNGTFPCPPTKPAADVCVPTGGNFTLSVTLEANAPPGIEGFQSHVFFGNLTYTPTADQGTEISWDDGTKFSPPAPASALPLRAVNPGNVQHADLTAILSPRPDATGTGNLLNLAMTCPTTQKDGIKVSLTTIDGDPQGSFLVVDNVPTLPKIVGQQNVDVNGDTAPELVSIADTLTINCSVPPPTPTPTNPPTDLKSATLNNDTGKALQGSLVTVSGSAIYGQDMDNDGFAGWGAVSVTITSTAGPVKDPIAVTGPANAVCGPTGPGAGGCVATVDKGSPSAFMEAVGAVNYSANINCANVGTNSASVTVNFLREDGSPVPPSKAINNQASVDVVCNPLVPPLQKLDKDEDGDQPGDALDNLFLTRQGAKIPPSRCEDGDDTAVLNETVGLPISSLDPKGSGQPQTIHAFEFEVRFNPKLVCVNIEPVVTPDQICTVMDKDSSLLEGIARIGCVTKKGGQPVPAPGPIARIIVRPQPELYSQLRPNQGNRIDVQILNQDCELADALGHPIPIFSCEDADISVRFLEGDVEPDCSVGGLDQQAIAFRWGATKGHGLYLSRMDLEPFGQVQGDGDIDIKDLQAVFGRHGSRCQGEDGPNPPQEPANPKA